MLSINSSFVFLGFNALEPCSRVVYFEYSNIFSGERLGLPAGLVCPLALPRWSCPAGLCLRVFVVYLVALP